MLQEGNINELNENLDNKLNMVVLVYTSMCGTCERAKVMLNVISEAIKDISFTKINVNLNQMLIKDYNITSIPCFLLFKEGLLIDQFYAFYSVTFLFDKIKQINC